MKTDALNATFSALADPTRRAILARLAEGEATVASWPRPRDEPAVRLAAPEGAGAGGPDRQGQVGAVAPVPARGRSARRGRRLAGAVPRFLRGAPHAPRAAVARRPNRRTHDERGAAAREFTLTWTLDAPPDDVFRAWTDPEHLGWYYNDEQPIPSEPIEVDLRVGGVWRQQMVLDESTAYVTGGLYREIVPNERLVFSWGAAGGWPELDPERLDDSPLVTVRSPQRGRHRADRQRRHPAAVSAESMPEGWFGHIRNGWQDTVDRLAASLAGAPAR